MNGAPPARDDVRQRASGLLRRAGWAPLAAIALHWVLGWFGVRREFDHLVHFGGGAGFAYFAWHACAAFAPELGSLRPLARHAFVFAATCTAALFVEFVEFASDQLLATHVQRGMSETMFDMLASVVGGIAVLALFALGSRRARG